MKEEQKLENPKKTYKDINLLFMGGAAIHDLRCWLCKKESAVYNMHPNWVFEPCWTCQGKLGGTIFRVKNVFIKWILK